MARQSLLSLRESFHQGQLTWSVDHHRTQLHNIPGANPASMGIAVQRTTARVDDLPQFPKLWQQRRQASEIVDKSVALTVAP